GCRLLVAGEGLVEVAEVRPASRCSSRMVRPRRGRGGRARRVLVFCRSGVVGAGFLPAAASVALSAGLGDERSEGTPPITGLGGPVQPVTLPGRGAELLGEFQNAVAVVVVQETLALGAHVRPADVDRPQVILAHAAIDDLRLAGLHVEELLAVLLPQRN